MILSNYHTHSNYCDGVTGLEEMIKAAIGKNIQSLGFSSHGPVPFHASANMRYEELTGYLASIEVLKNIYQDKIQIYKGLEIDFVPKVCSIGNFENFGLDYTIGSVHYVFNPVTYRYESFDHSAEDFKTTIEQVFDNNFEKYFEYYFGSMLEMVNNGVPDIIAHFDVCAKFNKNNCFFDENSVFYKTLINDTITAIAKTNCLVEINTRRMYRGFAENYYPAPWIIKRMIEKEIRFTVNADAHNPSEVNLHLSEAREMLAGLGCKHVYVLWNGKWTEDKI